MHGPGRGTDTWEAVAFRALFQLLCEVVIDPGVDRR